MKLYVFFLIVATTCSYISTETNTLQLVHVFFRHGSRTPELKDIYPTDPYTADAFWPMGYGALTNKGKQASYKLGLKLRERYQSLLGDLYIPEDVEAVSTDFDRTKMTLLLVLAGLYPPATAQKWNESMSWMPIPIHFDKDRYDYSLRRPIHYCPTYVKELEEVLLSDDAQQEVKAHRELFQYLEKHTKKTIRTLNDVLGIYQTLNAEETMNLTLPEWAQSIYPDKIHEVAAKQCNFENYNAVLKRLNGGRMLGKIVNNMLDKAEKRLSPNRKVFLYSGHENNVINILAALNLFKPHVPRYSAAVIVELHYFQDLNNYGVKVLYLKDANSEPEEQKLEDCNTFCPLDEFIRIVDPHVPFNYTAECHSHVKLD